MNEFELERDDPNKPLLERIHAGMTAFDRNGKEVGTVNGVVLGRPVDRDTRQKTGGAAGSEAAPPEALTDEPLPPGTLPPVAVVDPGLQKTLQEPEMRGGYIRVANEEPGEPERYVPANAIERVDGWQVFLKVGLEEMGDEG
jgi:hypothetical protein